MAVKKKKGIYCLEGFWFGAKDRTSVSPVLDLLNRCGGINSMYHRCATKEELEFMIKRWGLRMFQKDYPIMYFATHGIENALNFGKDAVITLDEIADLLEGKCERAIFYFGSCDTLNIDKRRVNAFLEKTKALAAIGYKKEVDWLLASSVEMLVLNYLQECHFDSRGIAGMEATLRERFGSLTHELDFIVVPNSRIYFPRKRKKKTLRVV